MKRRIARGMKRTARALIKHANRLDSPVSYNITVNRDGDMAMVGRRIAQKLIARSQLEHAQRGVPKVRN